MRGRSDALTILGLTSESIPQFLMETFDEMHKSRGALYARRLRPSGALPHSWMSGYIFTVVKTFAQVLDSADELGVDEQESLVEVLQRRLAGRRREALLEAVTSAQQELQGRPLPSRNAETNR